MKRYIRSSSYIKASTKEWTSGDFEELKDYASDYGYKLNVSKGEIPKLMFTAKQKDYPKIEVETIDSGSGTFVFSTTVKFKDIEMSEDMFYDDVKSILQEWADKTGELVTKIQTFIYDPSISTVE